MLLSRGLHRARPVSRFAFFQQLMVPAPPPSHAKSASCACTRTATAMRRIVQHSRVAGATVTAAPQARPLPRPPGPQPGRAPPTKPDATRRPAAHHQQSPMPPAAQLRTTNKARCHPPPSRQPRPADRRKVDFCPQTAISPAALDEPSFRNLKSLCRTPLRRSAS